MEPEILIFGTEVFSANFNTSPFRFQYQCIRFQSFWNRNRVPKWNRKGIGLQIPLKRHQKSCETWYRNPGIVALGTGTED